MKILLRQDEVNPDKPDNWGKTPLMYAAEQGCEGVVKVLLGRRGINPDKPDNFGTTPLMYATWRGHKKVIALLRPHDEAITPDAT